tara:strand:+ start:94 stop:570 length:477 start_codon:yes stop_codon:yes gene_type:complete
MKEYIEYDWPQIPKELLYNTVEQITKLQDHSPNNKYRPFRSYLIDDKKLLDHLQPYFDFDVSDEQAFYQIVRRGLHTHIDQNRKIVYNYLIDTGGDAVNTIWFEDDRKTEQYRKCIPSNTWHSLDVSIPHTVQGIKGTRIAITVFKKLDKNFIGYQKK